MKVVSFPREVPGYSGLFSAPSSAVAVVSAAFITLLFAASSDKFHHWFVIPVFVCGALAGSDAIDWLRGRIDLFDPVGIVGVLMAYNVFVAPLLHVQWDVWMWEVAPPSDWRDWIGRMAAINVVAIIAYLCSRKFFLDRAGNPRPAYIWRPDHKIFWITGVLLLCLTSALQIWIFWQHGGILGYIEDFRDPEAHYKFEGMGPVYMVAESFPMILGLLIIVYRTRRPMKQPWLLWAFVLLTIFVSRMLTGGLLGSRLSMVMSVFWMAGAIHLVRPIPRRLFAVGSIFIVAFLYLFLTYKHGGDLDKLLSAEERNRINDIHHTSLEGVLLGDLGRADIQAYLLYKLVSDPQEIRYAYGSTYLAAASITVPRFILPAGDRPIDKTVYGADYIYGPGSFIPGVIWSSRIYGLAGEAMMNFSPFSIPVAFLGLGFVVARLRRFSQSLKPGDLRLFLLPFGVYICIWMYVSDADNFISQFFLYGLVPIMFIVGTARRFRLQAGSDPYSRIG